MDQVVQEHADDVRKGHHHDVAVAVITPKGLYPSEDELARVDEKTVVAEVLKRAADKLKITNTTDWVATIDGKEIDTRKTFKELNLSCIVEIDYHKHEGGGGA
ncbi:hypothetical protein [Bradyrhizobium arachidis]|uniref:hypothetical protein n=1 Tax=Bradyrhizobium arachidis TaxID=858423 RepID=UPI00216177CE|nr:hypothetical protein [Bradyrhizobium arachidis]UVO28162.1 hypothetical protein KUF59_37780 [Bradyrhizobium arachidis]